jgi:acyl-CoA synthetase (AMP-forming)/AMP-acid ligase II
MLTADTLAAAFERLHDDRGGLTHIESGDRRRAFSPGQIRRRALGLLRHFQDRGARPGDEVIIVAAGNVVFIDAFWACMLGGLIAVPVAPGAGDAQREKLFRIAARLNRPLLATDRKNLTRLTELSATLGQAGFEGIVARAVVFDDIHDLDTPGAAHAARPDDIAFIQFSSGSTSAPKGVTLTHANLLANLRGIVKGMALTADDRTLSWMPLTHDMGLIGFHLTFFLTQTPHAIMPTELFVRRPRLWLEAASELKSTVLCSPNFGLRHYLKAIAQAGPGPLDLSAVRLIFNGAEPISVATCREFMQRLAPCGLRPDAMYPVYGLAEASLAVTFPPPGAPLPVATLDRRFLGAGQTVRAAAAGQPDAVEFACVGNPVAGCEVRIGREGGGTAPDGEIGRILIRGANVTRGYYNDPAITAETLSADGWLDTGDLGCRHAGQLVITGRHKEIIFVNGQNYYPHDLEAVLESHLALEAGRIAACGCRPPGMDADELVVFVQHRADAAAFAATVRDVKRVLGEHAGVAADQVLPVPRIPKTTSGKLQRYQLAEAYLRGEFKAVRAELAALADSPAAPADAAGEIERTLLDICADFLGKGKLGPRDNVFEIGTSSLTLAQIYERIEQIYPGKLEITDFFDYPTIAELARYLHARLTAAQS